LPFGKGIKESLNYTLAIGKELGFSVYNYDNYAGVIEAGEGDDYSGILCHLKSFGIKCSDDISGDLTVTPGALEISADKLVFGFDIRFPVTADKNIIVEQLKKVIERYDLEYRELQYKAPLYIPKESILIKKLQRAYSAVTGEDPKLVAIGGGTYSRYLDNSSLWTGFS
jgi:succinyl-diaminopimelate desuccinylase